MNCSCGPWWLRRSIRAELSRHFEGACALHDKDYKEAVMTRKQADTRFLSRMTWSAGHDKRLRRWAFIFYWSVRIGGWASWGRQ